MNELPHSDEAELAILATCLLSKDGALEATERLHPEYFYRGAHRVVFEGVRDLIREGRPVDVVTLGDALRSAGTFNDAGGYDYLGRILDGFGHDAHLSGHMDILKDRWALRELLVESDRVRMQAQEKAAEGRELLRGTEARLAEIGTALDSGKTHHVRLGDALRSTVHSLRERMDDPEAHAGIRTGFPRLDRMMTGLRPGELGVLAARPSMGKTALALAMIRNVAARDHIPTLLLSLEMSEQELGERILAIESGVQLQRIRSAKLDDEDYRAVTEASARLASAPLIIDDGTAADIGEVRAAARRVVRKEGVGLVVVDYLQLLESRSASRDGRTAEVGHISRQLKQMARELQVPVLAVAQLSRGPEQRTNKRPMLSDLRESGAIEQDADFVWMLFRAAYYMTEEERRRADPGVLSFSELLVQKQRNGPTGMVPLHFDQRTARFLEREQDRR